MKNMLVFVVAAFLQIAGCFPFWAWLRNGASPASLIWLWRVEGQRPSVTDLAGAAIAIAGALVIVGFSARQ